jgi:hypothetical protein
MIQSILNALESDWAMFFLALLMLGLIVSGVR